MRDDKAPIPALISAVPSVRVITQERTPLIVSVLGCESRPEKSSAGLVYWQSHIRRLIGTIPFDPSDDARWRGRHFGFERAEKTRPLTPGATPPPGSILTGFNNWLQGSPSPCKFDGRPRLVQQKFVIKMIETVLSQASR